MKSEKFKPVFLRDPKAIELIHKKAKAEGRSLSNATARTIIESLSPKYDQFGINDSLNSHGKQD